MIRTGQQYRDSIRDGRQVWINGERVKDVSVHLMFRPLVDVRARIYDMQHDPRFAHALSYWSEVGEVCAVALKLPRTPAIGEIFTREFLPPKSDRPHKLIDVKTN